MNSVKRKDLNLDDAQIFKSQVIIVMYRRVNVEEAVKCNVAERWEEMVLESCICRWLVRVMSCLSDL